MAARCSNDLAVRRKIDAVVYEVRKEMAKVALEMADKCGEPPLASKADESAPCFPVQPPIADAVKHCFHMEIQFSNIVFGPDRVGDKMIAISHRHSGTTDRHGTC
jgi:hypothetical protein